MTEALKQAVKYGRRDPPTTSWEFALDVHISGRFVVYMRRCPRKQLRQLRNF